MRSLLACLTVWTSLALAGPAVGVAQSLTPDSSAPVSMTPLVSTPRYTFFLAAQRRQFPHRAVAPPRGPEVTVDAGESAAWRALHEPGLTAFERDRRAILAITSEYRVTFDFLEIATFAPGAPRDRPYQSWGTERIYVDRDDGTFISLVHILEMRIINKGRLGERPDGAEALAGGLAIRAQTHHRVQGR